MASVFIDRNKPDPNALNSNSQGEAAQNLTRLDDRIKVYPYSKVIDLEDLNGNATKLEFKLSWKTQPKILDTFIEKAAALVSFKNAGIIDDHVALITAGLEKWAEYMDKVRIENERKQIEIFGQQGAQQIQAGQQQPNNNNNKPPQFQNQAKQNDTSTTDNMISSKPGIRGKNV